MPIYTQKVTFERVYEIEAKNAHSANEKLDRLVHDAEFAGDVQAEGTYEFEDEDVSCPVCGGCGYEYESEEDQCGHDCSRCQAQGTIPFSEQ